MCYDPRAHCTREVPGSVPNLTQELNWKHGYIEVHGSTQELTKQPESSRVEIRTNLWAHTT